MTLHQRNINAIVSKLLEWYAKNARDLPWRRTTDPYCAYVSEIMLQQTQVKTVIPYWERWMRKLPTIPALAAAAPETVLKLWEGLGYYSRARNMHKAAQLILEKHGGEFPTHFDDVLALPGIGRYTAGAICSIAFNQPIPILDGNVIRVLARLFGVKGNPREKSTNTRLWTLAEQLVTLAARRNTRKDWACSRLNQALMEIGATVCTPTAPKCGVCPVRRRCVARATGRTESLPELPQRVPSTARRFAAFVVEDCNRFLLRQRPDGVVNAGFWEFPNTELVDDQASPEEIAFRTLKIKPASVQPLCTVKHTITRYRITLDAYRVEAKRSSRMVNGVGRWLTFDEVERLPLTSAHRKILQTIPTASSQGLQVHRNWASPRHVGCS